jgi:hypothetical protein
MPATVKSESSRTHREPSFVSLLSSWAQQGAQSFFTTQRIILDLVMRQNASVMHSLRQQLSDPRHSPTAILGEVAGESVKGFIEGQKVLLELGLRQHEILMGAVKERIGDQRAVRAITDLLQRGVETFIHMQQEFLKIAGKQTHTWVEAAKAGKPYQPELLAELAREGMENFVKAQKQFMDVIAEETARVTGSRHTNGARKIKKTELAALARQATESFIDAQKKLVDLAGQQMNANVKTAGKAMELLKPFPFVPFTELTRQGVKSYVDAEKALIDVMVKPTGEHKGTGKTTHRAKARAAKRHAAAAA